MVRREYKVIICVIIAVWLFGLGILAGSYTHRDNSQLPDETTAKTTVEYNSSTVSSSTTAKETEASDTSTQVATTKKPNNGSKGELVDGRFTSEAQAIKSNCFYIEGKQYSVSDDKVVPLKFATDGTDSQLIAKISGVEISMYLHGGEVYLIYGGNYLKLSQTIMNMFDINLEDYNFDSSFIKDQFDDTVPATVEEATLDDKKVTSTRYTCKTGNIVIYSNNDELLQVEQYDADTNALECITYVDYVVGNVPYGMLTLDGLNKQSYVAFFKNLMNAAGEQASE